MSCLITIEKYITIIGNLHCKHVRYQYIDSLSERNIYKNKVGI